MTIHVPNHDSVLTVGGRCEGQTRIAVPLCIIGLGEHFAGSIDDLVSQEELRRISEAYKEVAGFSLARLSG